MLVKKRGVLMKIFVFLVMILISLNMVSAVGIKWFTEGETVQEEDDVCIKYGAYNPSSNDIKVKIEVTDELKEIVIGKSSEDKIVKAGTKSSEAEEINFCFKVPNVYEKDCLIGNLVCEQMCGQEVKSYQGELVMTEELVEASGGGTAGSGATIAASAPLKIIVSCNKHDREWGLVYITAIILVLCITGILLYRKYRTPKIVRDKEKLNKLQAKIKSEEGKK